MANRLPVPPDTFEAIQNVDIDKLSSLSEREIRPVLPCLVRMSLCAPLDTSDGWTEERKKILKCLSGIELVNNLVALLSIDFHELEQDARKEQQLRSKSGSTQQESVLVSHIEHSVALEFERSDPPGKLRLLLSDLLYIFAQVKDPKTEFFLKGSELFESDVYLEEVADVLCISQAELPGLLPVNEVAEALLHLQNGAWLLCRLVANVPDSFSYVCRSLVSRGEKQDEESVGGQRRAEALRLLCEMCPSQALTIRSLCISNCRLPSLAVALTLHHCQTGQGDDAPGHTQEGLSDVVAFVSGLLLGSDIEVRHWFSQFIRTGQKRKDAASMLHSLRQELLEQLMMVLPERAAQFSQRRVVQGCAFIRTYCALKCIAGLRFNDEESQVLLRLVTCHPQPSASGVRFVCLGLCMLLSCPYLLSGVEQEKLAIDWIKWLVRESSKFERVSGVKASFGEMLLLIAIHFHSNQNSAIGELVSETLGMKSAVKGGALARMKTIFTQDIFTEQVVASHAVKVSVTPSLSADIPGYLPVHCIYQLLKSRAFSKHKVSIKDWIFRQLCNCTTPIHMLVPPLMEAYINSIIVPSAKTDRTNKPITEVGILSMFKDSELSQHLGNLGSKRRKSRFISRAEEPMDVDGSTLEESEQQDLDERKKFTAQLLLLYYVLLYQDVLLNNMKSIVSSGRTVLQYSPQLLAQLPIKALLQQAQQEQHLYVRLFAPMLRLLATHYPHLCLVEDWLEEGGQHELPCPSQPSLPGKPCTPENLTKAYDELSSNPTLVLLHMEHLVGKSPSELLPFTDVLLSSLPLLLNSDPSRQLLDLTRQVWIKLHTIIPRRLRVMTVNVLRPENDLGAGLRITEYTEKELTEDPLVVLRCHDKVYRCCPILEMILRSLEGFLQASRCALSQHIQATPTIDKTGHLQPTQERDELRFALVSAQDSAVVQILLECCLPSLHEKGGLLSELREVQCLVCSHLHQMFIADPGLAKLVHFQGYPRELLSVTVAGIPSMHICLDFIPELLAQPHLEKQVFAIDLVSHLSLQYALPKSLSIAKLTINIMSTLLGVLPGDNRPDFFHPLLPATVRIARAFPPLADDIVTLLAQLGRISASQLASLGCTTSVDASLVREDEFTSKVCLGLKKFAIKGEPNSTLLNKYASLYNSVQETFTKIVDVTSMLKDQLH